MLFTTVSNEELNKVNNFFNDYEAVETVTPEEVEQETAVSKYITSLVTSCHHIFSYLLLQKIS